MVRSRFHPLLLVFLIPLLQPSPATAEEPSPGQRGNVWDLGVLEIGRTYPTTVSARNLCPGRNLFRIGKQNLPWLRITGSRELRVASGGIETSEAVVDLRGVSPGRYEGTLEIRCLDCPPGCRRDFTLLEVRMVAVAPDGDPPAPGTEAPVTTDVATEGGSRPEDCSELYRLYRAAHEAAEEARRRARQAFDPENALADELARADAALEAAVERRRQLELYLDDSSWIDGERGRITRGDLELLREARREVYDAWKAGEIPAGEAADAWSEIGAEDLEQLRQDARRELEQARGAEDRARRQRDDVEERMLEHGKAAREAREEAQRAGERAEELRRLYETRCTRPTEALDPEPPIPDGAPPPADTGSGGGGDEDGEDDDPCPDLSRDAAALGERILETRERNAAAARKAAEAFWGDPDSELFSGYRHEIYGYEVSKAQIGGQNQAGRILYEIFTSLPPPKTAGEVVGEAALGELEDRALDALDEWLVQQGTATRREQALEAYSQFLRWALRTNLRLVEAQALYRQYRQLQDRAEAAGCPVPEPPCEIFHRYFPEQFGRGFWKVEGELEQGMASKPVHLAPRPDGQGPFLLSGQVPCRHQSMWSRMFHFGYGTSRLPPPIP